MSIERPEVVVGSDPHQPVRRLISPDFDCPAPTSRLRSRCSDLTRVIPIRA
jgi:hypothetical protein